MGCAIRIQRNGRKSLPFTNQSTAQFPSLPQLLDKQGDEADAQ
jgi:hypothetical protein